MKVSLWIGIYCSVLIWSAIHPKDSLTWFMEVLPALLGGLILACTYKRFRLTPLLYTLILLHCLILMVGGHYTYAEVPLFNYIQDWLGHTRNNYDKVGHFAQGFVPALICFEVVVRRRIITAYSWQVFFCVCFSLAFSAFYELIEWWVALLLQQGAEAFLGTQGYMWDTQSDMFYALLGALLALFTLSRVQLRQIERLKET